MATQTARRLAYVGYPSEFTFSLPGRATGVDLTAFGVSARTDSLQALVDRMLNAPSGGAVDFRALPLVLVSFCHYDRLGSLDAPDSARGTVSYSEAAFWVCVVAARDVGPIRRGTVLVFLPYLFVNEPYALIGGREMLGLFKGLGVCRMPAAPDDPAQWSLEADAFARFAPDARAERMTLIQVTGSPGARAGAVPSVWESIEAGFHDIARLLLRGRPWKHEPAAADGPPIHARHTLRETAGRVVGRLSESLLDAEAVAGALEELARGTIPVLSLMQLRSGSDPAVADFQAIRTFTLQMRQPFRAGLLPGDFRLLLTPADSHPIAADLGLEADQPILFGSRATLDMDISRTTDLWPPAAGL